MTRAALHRVLRSDLSGCRAVAVTGLCSDDDGARVWLRDRDPEMYDLAVDAGQLAWRSIAPIRPAGLDGVEFWLGTDRFFGLCPVGEHVT